MRLFIVLCAALLLSAAPASAVDEGVIDGAGHPNVGWTGVDFDGPGPEPPTPYCTGSVVSDRVVLTAAHCVFDLPPESQLVFTLAAGSPRTPVTPPGVYPDDFPFTFNVPVVMARSRAFHPKFDPETRAHDVAVLLFKPRTFAGVKPVDLPDEGLLDRVYRQTFRLVGYGADPERGDGASQYIVEGYRQTRVTQFRRLTPSRLELAGGLCYGDSGSPQLIDNLAVSVFSDAGEDCDKLLAQRLDTAAERKFLARYL